MLGFKRPACSKARPFKDGGTFMDIPYVKTPIYVGVMLIKKARKIYAALQLGDRNA